MENTIKDKILRLKTVQEQLDAALKTYKEAITELESEKDKLVPEVMEAFKGQTVGAEKLKLKVDDFIVEIVQESEKETLSYKTMSELLMEEIKRLDITLSRTAQQLQEDSKAASIVKGRLKIGGVKVYENEEDSLSGKLINWLGKSSEIKNKTILSAEQSMEAIEDMMIKDYDETEANKYATPNMDDVESGALRQEGEDHEMEEGEDHEMEEGEDHEMEEGSWMETRAGANGEVFEMDEKLNEAINRYKKIINY
jgi:sugar-specific transcriptional regulator TrmB